MFLDSASVFCNSSILAAKTAFSDLIVSTKLLAFSAYSFNSLLDCVNSSFSELTTEKDELTQSNNELKE